MIRTNLFNESEAKKITERLGNFSVIEWVKDISNSYTGAFYAYYAAQMGVHKKQVAIDLNGSGAILQAGAMQMILGDIKVSTDVKGVGDLAKKLIGGKVTGESAIKPKYTGKGQVILEPTYKYIILEDMSQWSSGMVIEDGLFLACSDTVGISVVSRKNFSSALLGNEGLFNACLTGTGIVALESNVPKDELIIVDLENDTIKIDGSMAIAWSNTLEFTVERTTKTLIGSAASGEGLVNVYRGTGRILIAPVQYNPRIASASNPSSQTGSSGVNITK